MSRADSIRQTASMARWASDVVTWESDQLHGRGATSRDGLSLPRWAGGNGQGNRPRLPEGSDQPRIAASMEAMSIFLMGIMASKARFAAGPPLAITSVRMRGVICQLMPHLSLHQPH